MDYCRRCNIPLTEVMSFSRDGNKRYKKCAKCHYEGRKKPLDADCLDFAEMLHREMEK